MAARVLKHHKQNPYQNYHDEQKMTVFSPNDYQFNLLATVLYPASLRIMFVLLARLQSDGSAKVSFTDLRRIIRSPPPTLSRGLKELAHYNLITKRGNGDYWINPSLARSLSITG